MSTTVKSSVALLGLGSRSKSRSNGRGAFLSAMPKAWSIDRKIISKTSMFLCSLCLLPR